MGIIVIVIFFTFVLTVGLFIINKVTVKGSLTNSESVLDHTGTMSLEEYMIARKVPLILIRIGVFLLALDIAMLIVVVGVFDLNESTPDWENGFAILVMLIVPIISIFLIIRGFLKLNALKKQYNGTL